MIDKKWKIFECIKYIKGYARVWEDFKVGRRAWYLPHSKGDVVGQFPGSPQGIGELLGVL